MKTIRYRKPSHSFKNWKVRDPCSEYGTRYPKIYLVSVNNKRIKMFEQEFQSYKKLLSQRLNKSSFDKYTNAEFETIESYILLFESSSIGKKIKKS